MNGVGRRRPFVPGSCGTRNRLVGVALEAIAIADAVRRGYIVSKPLDGQGPYDFRIDAADGSTYRVEVKAGSGMRKSQLGKKCDVLIAIRPDHPPEWSWAPGIARPVETPLWEVA